VAELSRGLTWAAACIGGLIVAGCDASTDKGTPPAAAAPQAVVAPSPASTQGFGAYWATVRSALLAGRYESMVPAVRFPLELKRETDDSPVRRIDAAQLPGVLAKVLAADTGLSLREPLSNHRLIENFDGAGPPPRGVSVGAEQARVGALAFARTAQGWRLVRVYLED
jgi:hypothetical protein